MRRGILIISASMGAGHDGAARELRDRLVARGHEVTIVDYLTMIPFRLGGFVRWSYLFQLQRLPWTYDLTYQAFNKGVGAVLWGPVVRLMSVATRRHIRRELERTRPDAVVSTYPLASLVLGRMRKKRWIKVPIATFLTDFAVHPLWVHPGVDLHMAVSPISAETAAQRGAHINRASGPLVGARFTSELPDRDDMRRFLGIQPGQPAVLVVAGSWGVGDVASTVEAIGRCPGDYHPITVCGNDDKLRASLLEQGLGGTVLGWTDEMPGLMAAADALVENAGGLSAMEAFAAELPVISFQPIAGHGKDNAKYMSISGVSRYAHDEQELAVALREATTPGPARDQMIASAKALFASDPADDVVELATATGAAALLTPFQTPKGRRRVGYAAAVLVAVYFAMTIGAHGVSAVGVGVAKPPKTALHTVYLAVRSDEAQLDHAELVSAESTLGVTLVVDGRTASHAAVELHWLTAAGIDIANGGWGKGRFLRWNRAHDDCKKASAMITARSGVQVTEFVPGRALDAFDELYCRTGHHKQRLVRPNRTFRAGPVPTLESRKVYLLDARGADPQSVIKTLERFSERARHSGLKVRSLQGLR